MLISKCFVPFFVLCFAHYSLSKPTANELTQGRGVGSTIWGWITYPFSWWRSEEQELPAVNDQLIGPTTYGPYDNIEIGKHNVTVWCNDQTCTTMRCDKFGCKNVTCNIYDTNMSGECREYNTIVKPEEPVTPKPTEPTKPTVEDKVIATTKAPEVTSTAPAKTIKKESYVDESIDEHPLELEAVLSSTVTEVDSKNTSVGEKLEKSPSPKNKI